MGFSSKLSCYCNQKIAVCHYAIKLVACWLVKDTGKRDPLITSTNESISCSWVDGNMVSSPTESSIQYSKLSSHSQAYNLLVLLFNWMWRSVSSNRFWFNMIKLYLWKISLLSFSLWLMVKESFLQFKA